MKIHIISLLLFTLLQSCQSNSPEVNSKVVQIPLLNILIYDQSESFDYAQIKSGEIAKLLSTDATTSETWMAVVRVAEKNSLEQNLLLAGPFTLDTLVTVGSSIYEEPKLLRYNTAIRANFQQNLLQLQQQLEEDILLIRQLAHSDVNGALAYALRLVEQEQFRGAKIRLIVYSDLKHHLPGNRILQSFNFPPNVTIYPVLVNHTLNYETIFPNSTVYPLVDFRATFFQTSISLK